MRLLILRRILVATDCDPSSDQALDTAHRLAKLAGATLHVVHAIESPSGSDAGPSARREATDKVHAVLRRANVSGDDATLHVISGAPAETIRSVADRISADVIVVGPHRRRDSIKNASLGSTVRSVAEGAYAPCLIVGQPLRLPLERVLVPTDFSDTARGALLVGLSWASGLRTAAPTGATTVTALNVQPPHQAAGVASATASLERELDLLRRDAGSWAGVVVHGQTLFGTEPAQVIEERALQYEADLVVIGTRGQGGSDDSRLGSVSESVVLHNTVPTLLVPPAVWRVHASVR